jgi:hypothetical protein
MRNKLNTVLFANQSFFKVVGIPSTIVSKKRKSIQHLAEAALLSQIGPQGKARKCRQLKPNNRFRI